MTVLSSPFLSLNIFFSSNCIALSVTTSSVMARSRANGCSDFSGGAFGVLLLSIISAVCFWLISFIKLRKFSSIFVLQNKSSLTFPNWITSAC